MLLIYKFEAHSKKAHKVCVQGPQCVCSAVSVCTGQSMCVQGSQCVYRAVSVCTGPSVCVQGSQCVYRALSECTGQSMCVQGSQCVYRAVSVCTGQSHLTNKLLIAHQISADETEHSMSWMLFFRHVWCPSSRNKSNPIGWIFMKFDI